MRAGGGGAHLELARCETLLGVKCLWHFSLLLTRQRSECTFHEELCASLLQPGAIGIL